MSKVPFTASRVAAFKCLEGKAQAFLWDATSPGLGLRHTPSGKPAYVFQGTHQGKTIRMVIGSPSAWTIPAAQAKARELQRLIDEGRDPRAVKAEATAADAARRASETAEATLVADAWARYIAEGSPKRRDAWKPRYLADLNKMTAPGGQPKKRGEGKTLPGHLAPLMAVRLSEIDEDRLVAWFNKQSRRSKHQAARALMMFRGFLRWCSTQPALRDLVDRDAGKAPAIMAKLPEIKRRTDALEAAQVPAWWSAVSELPNPTASVYLRGLLLTGARREELAALRWDAVDFRWKKLTIADKVGDTRTIPLSDYLAELLAGVARAKGKDGKPNPFVFASTSKSGRIADPRSSHERALREAGIEGLTLHGLRRTFSLLGEAAGAPAGAIAQVMGHRPSATAEGYRPRSVDALRPYLSQIEGHILRLAGVNFVPSKARLSVVGEAA